MARSRKNNRQSRIRSRRVRRKSRRRTRPRRTSRRTRRRITKRRRTKRRTKRRRTKRRTGGGGERKSVRQKRHNGGKSSTKMFFNGNFIGGKINYEYVQTGGGLPGDELLKYYLWNMNHLETVGKARAPNRDDPAPNYSNFRGTRQPDLKEHIQSGIVNMVNVFGQVPNSLKKYEYYLESFRIRKIILHNIYNHYAAPNREFLSEVDKFAIYVVLCGPPGKTWFALPHFWSGMPPSTRPAPQHVHGKETGPIGISNRLVKLKIPHLISPLQKEIDHIPDNTTFLAEQPIICLRPGVYEGDKITFHKHDSKKAFSYYDKNSLTNIYGEYLIGANLRLNDSWKYFYTNSTLTRTRKRQGLTIQGRNTKKFTMEIVLGLSSIWSGLVYMNSKLNEYNKDYYDLRKRFMEEKEEEVAVDERDDSASPRAFLGTGPYQSPVDVDGDLIDLEGPEAVSGPTTSHRRRFHSADDLAAAVAEEEAAAPAEVEAAAPAEEVAAAPAEEEAAAPAEEEAAAPAEEEAAAPAEVELASARAVTPFGEVHDI